MNAKQRGSCHCRRDLVAVVWLVFLGLAVYCPESQGAVSEGPAVQASREPNAASSQGPLLSLGVAPDSSSYPPGQVLIFVSKARNLDPADICTFEWFLDNKPVRGEVVAQKSRDQSRMGLVFRQSGVFEVRVVMTSTRTGRSWSASRTVVIEAHAIPRCNILLVPELTNYVPPVQVMLAADCRRIDAESPEYRWYVRGEYVGSGRKIVHTFTRSGTYEVKLGVRMGSRFDELTAQRTITIGRAPLGPWVNKFEAHNAPKNLRICAICWTCWDEGQSEVCHTFDTIGPVDDYALSTGEQAEGYNAGFLVYSPHGSGIVKCRVYGFDFKEERGVVQFSRDMPMHGRELVPGTIHIEGCNPRSATVQWRCTDGSLCKARIWKHDTEALRRGNPYASGEVEDFGCMVPEDRDGAEEKKIRWKKSQWLARLQNGQLDIRGAGKYSWGDLWLTVDRNVRDFAAVGTGQGPVVMYKVGNQKWVLVMLYFADGSRQNEMTFNEPVSLVSGGENTAVVKVGSRCFDYGWKQFREIDCGSDGDPE